MISALLHDLVEDTTLTLDEITEEFGHHVASIVAELSKPEGGNKDEWLEKINSLPEIEIRRYAWKQ